MQAFDPAFILPAMLALIGGVKMQILIKIEDIAEDVFGDRLSIGTGSIRQQSLGVQPSLFDISIASR